MNTAWGLLLVLLFFNGCFLNKQCWTNYAKSQITGNDSIPSRPEVVNIGSILTLDSIIGKVSKIGLEAAIENVNNDPTILKGTKLKLTIHDSNFSGFLSIMEEQNMMSSLGRLVLIIWLLVVLIISSSYTASLTSILTVQKLSSPIEGISSLISTKDPIGYQQNSFVKNYLVEELGISETRLVPLNLPEDYEKALNDGPSNGGVAAIVDERPYIDLFLSTRCQFSIVGQQFTKNGWGFAFPRDSNLAVDISSAILKLSENGELQRIHDKWLTRSACSSQGAKFAVDRLELKSFKGLFFICGLACFIALFVYLILIIRQYTKHKPDLPEPSRRSLKPGRLKTFISFVDEKQESVKARSQKRLKEAMSRTSLDGNDLSVSGFGSTQRVSFSDTP